MVPALKAFALLLLYPTPESCEELSDIKVCLTGSERLSQESKDALSAFIDAMGKTELSKLQQNYVATLDIGKTASLNLFEHLKGDSTDRGTAMVELREVYREHGLELDSVELPDHLPVFLEFLSGLDIDDALVWLESAAALIAAIDRELQQEKSPWAAITQGLLDFTGVQRQIAGEKTLKDILPSIDAEWFEAPVRFDNAPKRF